MPLNQYPLALLLLLSLVVAWGRAAQQPYRFAEDYFQGEAASSELPPEAHGCRRVRKDSMMCMQCKDPKTNAKYEQCSYVGPPNEKAFAYTKSSSFGRPRPNKASVEDDSASTERDERQGRGSRPAPQRSYYPYSAEDSREGSEEDEEERAAEPSEAARAPEASESSGCRRIHKDGESCLVCTDPKTGAESERCDYAYEPKDRAYAYTRSKSFGYPSSSSSSSPASDESSDEHDLGDYARSQSERVSAEVDAGHRSKKGRERSPYSYDEDDSEDDEEEEYRPSESRDAHVSAVDSGFHDASARRADIERIVRDMGARDRSNCSRSQRGPMTCFRCKDAKGATDEECVFLADDEEQQQQPRRTREAEAYEFVAETRPVYDKILGISLPAYMIQRSPHEILFDQQVQRSRF